MSSKTCPICKSHKISFKIFGSSVVSGYVSKNKKESLNQPLFKSKINLCFDCSTLFQTRYKKADKIVHEMYAQHEPTNRASSQYINYYKSFSKNVIKIAKKQSIERPRILEIGCNNGLLLELIGRGIKSILYGIEPSEKFTDAWTKRKISGIKSFFNTRSAKKISSDIGTMDIVIARHVLEHIADPHDFFIALNKISNNNTIIFIEVPYLISILKRRRYENVSYSHLIHYSVRSILNICKKHNFSLIDYSLVETDGGSILFKLCKKNIFEKRNIKANQSKKTVLDLFNKFFIEFQNDKKKFKRHVESFKQKKILGFGAGAKGIYLTHIFGLKKYLFAVLDETNSYNKKFIPGTIISIRNPKILNKLSDSIIINLAPTHSTFIKSKLPDEIPFIDLINSS